MNDRERAHLAELERRLDTGDTFDKLKQTLPRDFKSIQAGRIDPGGATTFKHTPLPVSLSMPKACKKDPATGKYKPIGTVVNRFGTQVRALPNGHYATMNGTRIVDSKEARAAHAAETGMVVEK